MAQIKNRFTDAVIYSSDNPDLGLDDTVREYLAKQKAKGERADLRGADLRSADLSSADLRGAYLRGADLRGADLRGADLRGADLSSADLRGAYLRGADLSSAYLSSADLRGAYLRGADLRGADLRGAYLRGAYLRGADLSSAYLSSADLRGAYLRGADLRGADLRGADLRGADLSSADLRGAYLRGADLRGAIGLPDPVPPDPEEPYVRATAETDAERLARYRRHHPDVPIVENLDRKILEAIEAGGELDMSSWHTCQTTHCRAGWAITLAGEAGKELEAKHDSERAGALIYRVSTGRVPNFFATNEAALADIRECAKAQE